MLKKRHGNPLIGVLHFFSETGSEGGYWAFQDNQFITENTTIFCCSKCFAYWDKSADSDSPLTVTHAYPLEIVIEMEEKGTTYEDCPPDEHIWEPVSPDIWSYEGLHVLENDDTLIIYDKQNPDDIVWQGDISLREYDLFTEHAFGMWIHADQRGVDRETWAMWFFEEYPAKLMKARFEND
ncbi:MAG: hypothetical protein WD712_02255 [Candidatus Spechtbacterales bacterium]